MEKYYFARIFQKSYNSLQLFSLYVLDGRARHRWMVLHVISCFMGKSNRTLLRLKNPKSPWMSWQDSHIKKNTT